MKNEELNVVVDELITKLKEEKSEIVKNERLAYLTITTAIGCLFLGDIKHFINADGYQNIALIVDFLLGSGTYALGSHIIKDSTKKDELKLVKEKLLLLKNIQQDLQNGINEYSEFSIDNFIESLNIKDNNKQLIRK